MEAFAECNEPITMKLNLVVLLCFCTLSSFSQNLVINGDFELYDQCPQVVGSVNGYVQDVYNPQTDGTTDFFNDCSPSVNNCDDLSYSSIPLNLAGYQVPYSGNGMMGQVYWQESPQINYHEYFICKLSQTLEKDSLYEISCQIVLANHSGFATDMYTIAFIEHPIPITNMSNQTIFLDGININHNGYITDTLNWTELKHYYKANGSENYIVFGSFLDVWNVDVLEVDAQVLFCPEILDVEPVAYYYVDNVSVAKVPYVTFFPNVFTPNGDGVNDTFGCLVSGYDILFIEIINRWGETVFKTNEKNIQWNSAFEERSLNEGVYFYNALLKSQTDGEEIIKQGSVSLFK